MTVIENEIALTWKDIDQAADAIAREIMNGSSYKEIVKQNHFALFGVKRGGTHMAQAVSVAMHRRHSLPRMVENADDANIIIDDIIDSGNTKQEYRKAHQDTSFVAMINKKTPDASYIKLPEHAQDAWFIFPWELTDNTEGPAPQENVRRILQYLGEDPTREGLRHTPNRVLKGYKEMLNGYNKDTKELFVTFEESCDEMILVKDVQFTSMCEHHLLPFIGKAHIAYVPKDKVIGVSKLVRLFEIFAHRLQIQERLCQQVTKELDLNLNCLGSACVIEALHSCMSCRGVKQTDCRMVTSSLTGVFRTDGVVRGELFNLIKD